MPSPIFSDNGLEPIRTKDILTCGITTTPLSYPARIFFIHNLDRKDSIDLTYYILEEQKISFERNDMPNKNQCYISSINEIDTKTIKYIFRNFRNLHPKLNSNWRLPFWEIDTKDAEILELVLNMYRFMKLPVYVHETTMGYHFLCVKPIPKEKYSWMIKELRHTNKKYPPITLRIKPNKYIGEENVFFKGNIISDVNHTDTERLKTWIEKQDFVKIGQQYQIVWYSFEEKQEVVST